MTDIDEGLDLNWADAADELDVDDDEKRHRLSSVGTDSSHPSINGADVTGLDIASKIPNQPPYKLFVGKIPFSATEDHIIRYFESKGCSVFHRSCHILRAKDGSSRCSAFVEMNDPESMGKALNIPGPRMQDPANERKSMAINIEVAKVDNRDNKRNNRGGGQFPQGGRRDDGRRGGGRNRAPGGNGPSEGGQSAFPGNNNRSRFGGGGRNHRGGGGSGGGFLKQESTVPDELFEKVRFGSSEPKNEGNKTDSNAETNQSDSHTSNKNKSEHHSEPRERKPLELKPRSKKADEGEVPFRRSSRDEQVFGGAIPNDVKHEASLPRSQPKSDKKASSRKDGGDSTKIKRANESGGKSHGRRKKDDKRAHMPSKDRNERTEKRRQPKNTVPLSQAKVPSEEEKLARERENMQMAGANNGFNALLLDSSEESESDTE